MKKEYDFSKMRGRRRGRVVPPTAKVQKTVRLDLDVLRWLMREGKERGIPYQTLLNLVLKEHMRKSALKRDDFRDEIRKIVREELRKAS